jgi:hypothetical protein
MTPLDNGVTPVDAALYFFLVMLAVTAFCWGYDLWLRWYDERDRRTHDNLARRGSGRELLDLFDQDRQS